MAMIITMAMLLILAKSSPSAEATMRFQRDRNYEGSAGRSQALKQALVSALLSAGWNLDAAANPAERRRPDLLARKKGVKLAIEVKAMAEGRADRLIPLWSQAWLQAQRAAPAGHIPMAVVGAERVAPKAADVVLEFIQDVAPKASGGVIDLVGLRRFVGPHSEGLDAAQAPLPRNPERPKRVRGKLFSDLNQWMLKVLLAPQIPEQMLRAPRGRYQGPSELSAAANVSVMSASRLIHELRSEGYLDASAPYLRLVRVRHLLERWRSAVAAQPVVEDAWKAPIRGQARVLLERWLASSSGCLALFEAAREHGLGFVEGVPPHVYAWRDFVDDAHSSGGFLPVQAGEAADVFVRKPRALQSVLRGMVSAHGRPASDILQVWLDVSAHPSRGEEQAGLIWRKVLEPLCESASDE